MFGGNVRFKLCIRSDVLVHDHGIGIFCCEFHFFAINQRAAHMIPFVRGKGKGDCCSDGYGLARNDFATVCSRRNLTVNGLCKIYVYLFFCAIPSKYLKLRDDRVGAPSAVRAVHIDAYARDSFLHGVKYDLLLLLLAVCCIRLPGDVARIGDLFPGVSILCYKYVKVLRSLILCKIAPQDEALHILRRIPSDLHIAVVFRNLAENLHPEYTLAVCALFLVVKNAVIDKGSLLSACQSCTRSKRRSVRSDVMHIFLCNIDHCGHLNLSGVRNAFRQSQSTCDDLLASSVRVIIF